jgi:hypothetical protein
MNTTHMNTARPSEVPIGTVGREDRGRLQARAHDAWREAELQVQARWDAYAAADRGSARAAFAGYLAALDAEAATAAVLAQTHLDPAAAA